MPERRNRLPSGTRAASQRAVQKVFDNEQKLAELRGEERVRRRVREVMSTASFEVHVGDAAVDVVPSAAVEEALGL